MAEEALCERARNSRGGVVRKLPRGQPNTWVHVTESFLSPPYGDEQLFTLRFERVSMPAWDPTSLERMVKQVALSITVHLSISKLVIDSDKLA